MANQVSQKNNLFETQYGYFSSDGTEYIIKTPFTPKPWVNIICPSEFGSVITQLGTGYSFYKNPALFRLTYWIQDIVKEEYGKFIYLKNKENGEVWSVGYKPTCKKTEKYICVHGIGYSKLINENNGILSELTIFVPPKDNLEVQILKLKNLTNKTQKLELYTYFEWFLRDVSTVGVHNEFQKLFIETDFQIEGNATTIVAKKLNGLLDVFGFCSCLSPIESFTTDKEDFIGIYNDLKTPQAVLKGVMNKKIGRYVDPISSFMLNIELQPQEEKEVVFLLGVVEKKSDIRKVVEKFSANAALFLTETKNFWIEKFSKLKVETDDKKLDIMTNLWLKYQAISCRINARTGYFQPAGGIGYRDQLQDSMIYLPTEPQLTKKQILLHAQHQFSDGNVYHWWLPIIESGPVSKHSDPYLWLPYTTLEYLKETNDFSILNEKIEFIDDKKKTTLYDHCIRAINLSLKRFSKRGLPLIGEGDWNDGLSAAGKNWKGESVWLGHFLYVILNSWVEMLNYCNTSIRDKNLHIKRFSSVAKKLKQKINDYCWDGEWFWGVTKDNGELIGSKKCKEGKIFLNSQTWAVIGDIVEDKKRLNKMLNSIEKFLYQKYGPVLLYPSYAKQDKEVGYLTEYAPSARENGGLYVHAGCWALLMECKLKRTDKVGWIYTKLNPAYRAEEPDVYKTEPYVTCGDIYGPASPLFGQGGWSWYSGSAPQVIISLTFIATKSIPIVLCLPTSCAILSLVPTPSVVATIV